MGVWNETLPDLYAGDIPSGEEWASIVDALRALASDDEPYTPTWAAAAGAVSLGSGGGITGAYTQVGKYVALRMKLLAGTGVTTGTPGTYWTFSLPAGHVAAGDFTWAARMLNFGVLEYSVTANIAQGASTLELYQTSGRVTTASPFAFGDGDSLWTSGVYKIA